MAGNPKGSGQRSNLYSEQRFTNWRPNDPYWAEVEALPKKMRPRIGISRDSEESLGVFDRPLAEGFVRPWSLGDVADVLRSIPKDHLLGLSGIYLLGGTSRQRSTNKLTYGMYSDDQIFLFALPKRMLVQHWSKMPKPSLAQAYTKFGANITPDGKGGAILRFDLASIRSFYLYDVLLHEVGHHIDRDHGSDNAERYARWFAEFQHSKLLKP